MGREEGGRGSRCGEEDEYDTLIDGVKRAMRGLRARGLFIMAWEWCTK